MNPSRPHRRRSPVHQQGLGAIAAIVVLVVVKPF